MIDEKLVKAFKRVLAYRHGKSKKLSRKDLDKVLFLAETLMEIYKKLNYLSTEEI